MVMRPPSYGSCFWDVKTTWSAPAAMLDESEKALEGGPPLIQSSLPSLQEGKTLDIANQQRLATKVFKVIINLIDCIGHVRKAT